MQMLPDKGNHEGGENRGKVREEFGAIWKTEDDTAAHQFYSQDRVHSSEAVLRWASLPPEYSKQCLVTLCFVTLWGWECHRPLMPQDQGHL